MDENKLQKLKEINYKILNVCGLCKHSFINLEWGVCKLLHYKHRKHTKQDIELSIYFYGSCDFFEFDEERQAVIRKWEQFINSKTVIEKKDKK